MCLLWILLVSTVRGSRYMCSMASFRFLLRCPCYLPTPQTRPRLPGYWIALWFLRRTAPTILLATFWTLREGSPFSLLVTLLSLLFRVPCRFSKVTLLLLPLSYRTMYASFLFSPCLTWSPIHRSSTVRPCTLAKLSMGPAWPPQLVNRSPFRPTHPERTSLQVPPLRKLLARTCSAWTVSCTLSTMFSWTPTAICPLPAPRTLRFCFSVVIHSFVIRNRYNYATSEATKLVSETGVITATATGASGSSTSSSSSSNGSKNGAAALSASAHYMTFLAAVVSFVLIGSVLAWSILVNWTL